MAANPRRSATASTRSRVHWCCDAAGAQAAAWSRCTTPTATGTPTSSTPTSRAAPRTARRCTSRRSTAPTGTTSSPCRCPTDRLDIVVNLHTDDGARSRRSPASASSPARPPARAPRRRPARQRPDPGPRHLAVAAPPTGPAPPRPPPGRSPMTSLAMTHDRPPSLPPAPCTTPPVPAPVARAATSCPYRPAHRRLGRRRAPPLPRRRQPARRHRRRGHRRRGDGRTLGRGGPRMVVHRPEEFFARLGRDQLIGFGEAYLTGAWDAEDLGGFLTVLAAEMRTWSPSRCRAARGRDASARRGTSAAPRTTPRTTSRTTTTCPTTCSSCSSTRR